MVEGRDDGAQRIFSSVLRNFRNILDGIRVSSWYMGFGIRVCGAGPGSIQYGQRIDQPVHDVFLFIA